MHSRSFDLGAKASINRIRSLRLPCNLSSQRPDTRRETSLLNWRDLTQQTSAKSRGRSIRQPMQVQVRYLRLFFERLFTRPTDQPRHAARSSNHQSKPVHPPLKEITQVQPTADRSKMQVLSETTQKSSPSVGSTAASIRSTCSSGMISPSSVA